MLTLVAPGAPSPLRAIGEGGHASVAPATPAALRVALPSRTPVDPGTYPREAMAASPVANWQGRSESSGVMEHGAIPTRQRLPWYLWPLAPLAFVAALTVILPLGVIA